MKIIELLMENEFSKNTAMKIAKELHQNLIDLTDILKAGSTIGAGNPHNINSLRKDIGNLAKELNDLGYEYDPRSEGMISKLGNLAEKWSQKYKRSIDCSHPKGFSQRAHCQGRKKK